MRVPSFGEVTPSSFGKFYRILIIILIVVYVLLLLVYVFL